MATAETVVITLQEQISGPADAAVGGLSRLEAQILREQAALGALETKLQNAKDKTALLAAGDVGERSIAAYQRQAAAVASLEARLEAAQAAEAALAAAPSPDAAALAAAAAHVRTLGAAADVARAQLVAMGDPSAGVVDVAKFQRAAGQVDYFGVKCQEQVAKIEQLKAELAGLGSAADAPAAKVKKLGAAMGEAEGPAGISAESMGDLGESVKRLAGPLGEQAEKIQGLGKALAKLGPEGAIVAVTLLVLAAAAIAMVAGFVKAINAADQYRDELLKLAGATEGNMEAAKELQATITAVASASATSREKIADFAGQLARAGLSGAELKNALEAAAIAASVGGDQMASEFLKSVEAAKKAGGSVDELANKIKEKLGGIAAKQLLSLSVQWAKLKENVTGLFSGAEIEPLLEAMHELLSLFDQTTAEGQAMRAAIGSAIESIIGVVLQLGTAMLNAYVWIKQHPAAWSALKMVFQAVAVGAIAIGAAIMLIVGIIGAAVGLIAAGLGVVVQGFVDFFSAIGTIASAITAPFSAVKAWLSSFSLSDTAANIMAGILSGLGSVAGAVIDAIIGPFRFAIGAVKALLGIASPSKVFAGIGVNVGAGMVEGVDSTASDVEASASGLADAAVTGAAAGKKAAGALASSSATPSAKGFAPTFSNCQFVGTTRREIEEMMRAVFEAESLAGAAS